MRQALLSVVLLAAARTSGAGTWLVAQCGVANVAAAEEWWWELVVWLLRDPETLFFGVCTVAVPLIVILFYCLPDDDDSGGGGGGNNATTTALRVASKWHAHTPASDAPGASARAPRVGGTPANTNEGRHDYTTRLVMGYVVVVLLACSWLLSVAHAVPVCVSGRAQWLRQCYDERSAEIMTAIKGIDLRDEAMLTQAVTVVAVALLPLLLWRMPH